MTDIKLRILRKTIAKSNRSDQAERFVIYDTLQYYDNQFEYWVDVPIVKGN